MESLLREKTMLSERINRVEKQNQRLKTCMVVLSMSFLALLLMGAKAGVNDGHFRQVIAEGISIVDGTGQEIMLIGSQKGVRDRHKNS